MSNINMSKKTTELPEFLLLIRHTKAKVMVRRFFSDHLALHRGNIDSSVNFVLNFRALLVQVIIKAASFSKHVRQKTQTQRHRDCLLLLAWTAGIPLLMACVRVRVFLFGSGAILNEVSWTIQQKLRRTQRNVLRKCRRCSRQKNVSTFPLRSMEYGIWIFDFVVCVGKTYTPDVAQKM